MTCVWTIGPANINNVWIMLSRGRWKNKNTIRSNIGG